ncbi:MAG: redoxin family protein [Planctomycetota bacterium]
MRHTAFAFICVACLLVSLVSPASANKQTLPPGVQGPLWPTGARRVVTVTTPSGEPASNATAGLIAWTRHGTLRGHRLTMSDPAQQQATSETGLLQFTLPDERGALVVTHPTGIGIVEPEDLDRATDPIDLQLQAWSTIEGKLSPDITPRVGEVIDIQPGHWLCNTINYDLDAMSHVLTDEAGRFRFDHVIPGENRVSHRLKSRSLQGGSIAWPRHRIIYADPGQTTTVVFEDHGSTLSGTVVLAEQAKDASALGDTTVRLVPAETFDQQGVMRPRPDDFSLWPSDDRRAWVNAWNLSPAHTQWVRAMAEERWAEDGAQTTKPDPDGQFHLPGVPSGSYVLTAKVWREVDGVYGSVASVELPVDVIENSANPHAALDLGRIVLSSHPELKVGDRLPDFTATSLPIENEPTLIRLNDFAGRYVLLDFWATWCGPCLRQTPILDQAARTHADDDRVAWLAVSVDQDPERPTTYIQGKSLAGVQLWLNDTQRDQPATRIPMGLPSIMLLSPEREVLYLGHSAQAAVDRLTHELASLPNP